MASRRSSTSARRRSAWARQNTVISVPAGGISLYNPIGDLQAAGASTVGCTVARVRGTIMCTTAAAAGLGVAGLITADRASAIATYAVAANGPAFDREADWFGYIPFAFNFNGADIKITDFDVKAMRRMDEFGMGLYMVFQPGLAASISIFTSVLLLLP